MPSPLTSPAPAPRCRCSRMSIARAGSRCCRRARRDRGWPEAGGGAEHDIACAGPEARAVAPLRRPTIRSSMPSPLTSPRRRPSSRSGRRCVSPSRRKPLLPSSAARSRLGAKAGGGAEHDIARAGIDRRFGRRSEAADDQVVDAVAVDVARAGDRDAAVVAVVDPVEAEAVAAVERGEIEARREARGGAEHDVARAGSSSPPGSAPGAPTIRSSMPSPLTSPAPATETAAASSASIPSRRKPLLPSSAARSRLAAKPAAVPNTT